MNRYQFPSRKIADAYKNAKHKVFTKRISSVPYIYVDQNGVSNGYDHTAMAWLEDNRILEPTINRDRWVFEYRIVK